MKAKLFALFLLLVGCIPGRGATVTNMVLNYSHSGPSTTIYTVSLGVKSNAVARVLHLNIFANAGNPNLIIEVGGTNVAAYNMGDFSPFGGAPVVAGPATLRLTATVSGNVIGSGTAFCAVEITSAEDTFIPSNAVVVPADAGGPVNIILESSVDLVSWTPTLPGTYGTNTVKRFFRVRAERSQ